MSSDTNQNTLQIDSNRLSESVRKDLKEDLDMDDEFADQKAKEIELDNFETAEPNSKSSLTVLRSWISDKLTVNGSYIPKFEINDIESKGEYLVLEISYDNNQTSFFKLKKDSKSLANLMSYKKVDNVSDLIGKEVMFNESKDFSIPKNVSYVSKVVYNLNKYFIILSKLSSKFEELDDERSKLNLSVGVSNLILCIALFPAYINTMIPYIGIFISIMLFSWPLVTSALQYLQNITKTDSYKVHIDTY